MYPQARAGAGSAEPPDGVLEPASRVCLQGFWNLWELEEAERWWGRGCGRVWSGLWERTSISKSLW